MQANCPNCGTIFRLTEDQLSVANGKVRCGLCHTVFTARSIDDESPDTDPEVIDNHIEEDELNSPDLIAQFAGKEQDDSGELFINDNETNNVIPDQYRALTGNSSSSPHSSIAWSLGILFLVFTLMTEYTWFNRNKLAHNANIQPWISKFCDITGCSLAPIHAPDQLEMVNRNIYTHPNIKNALMVTATMVNVAPYAQAYPDIEIGFSNVRGELVIQRIFSPEEYMKKDAENLRLLQPNHPVSFGLELKDPASLR